MFKSWNGDHQFELIKDRQEALSFFETLRESLRSKASRVAKHTATYKGGNVTQEAFFFKEGFWCLLFEGRKNRFWNSFGIGSDPGNASSRISIEINHPHEGIERRTSGRFLRDTRGHLALGHTGKIGGGLKGVKLNSWAAYIGKPREIFTMDGRPEELLLIADIDQSQNLVALMADYTRSAQDFRDHLKLRHD